MERAISDRRPDRLERDLHFVRVDTSSCTELARELVTNRVRPVYLYVLEQHGLDISSLRDDLIRRARSNNDEETVRYLEHPESVRIGTMKF